MNIKKCITCNQYQCSNASCRYQSRETARAAKIMLQEIHRTDRPISLEFLKNNNNSGFNIIQFRYTYRHFREIAFSFGKNGKVVKVEVLADWPDTTLRKKPSTRTIPLESVPEWILNDQNRGWADLEPFNPNPSY